MRFDPRSLLLIAGLLFLPVATGCGEKEGTLLHPTIELSSPAGPLTSGTQYQFTWDVTGTANYGVTFALVDGAASGTLSPDGLFTAGTTPGNYRISGTLVTNSSPPEGWDTDIVTVTVAAAP